MVLHIDIETFSDEDIRTAGAHRYIASPNFEVLMIAYAVDDGPVYIIDLAQGDEIPPYFLQHYNDHNVQKWAHNAAFERLSFDRIGMPRPISEWYCSAIKALYCGYPMSLEKVSMAMNLGDKSKDSKGKTLIRYFSVPCQKTKTNGGRTRNLPHHDPDKWMAFKAYCRQDVEAEREIEHRLRRYAWPEQEHVNYIIDQEINDRGVLVDMQLADCAVHLDSINKQIIKNRITELSGVANPKATGQMCTWLSQATGKNITSISKEAVEQLMKDIEPGVVSDVLELRKQLMKTSTAKYVAMQNCVSSDGRVRHLFQFYGANRTGRWAGRRIQLQNLPRNKMKRLDEARQDILTGDYTWASLLYENIPDILSQLIRTSFIAPSGKMFAVADFSAIEARVIAWLANEKWRLDVFNSHGKIYEASASMMFGVPLDQVDDELRSRGKIAELALGYQGAVGAMTAMDYKNQLTEPEMKRIIKQWRQKSPNIVKMWQEIEDLCIKAIETRRPFRGVFNRITVDCNEEAMLITLPSGRTLHYVGPRFTENKWGDRSIKYRGVDQTKGSWTWLETYGGKLTENIIQAIARDIMAFAIENLRAAGYQTVMHVHDETVIEVPVESASWHLDQICDIMGRPVPWANGLPLKAAGFVTNYYKKD